MTHRAPNTRPHHFWIGVRALILYPLNTPEITIRSVINMISPEPLAIAVALGKSAFQVDNPLLFLPSALISFFRQFGDMKHTNVSIIREKVDRIDSWLESIFPGTIEELRDTAMILMEAFDMFSETLPGLEHIAACRYLLGTSKHFCQTRCFRFAPI